MRTFSKFVGSMAAAALMAVGSQAFACGGNQCVPYSSEITSIGQIWGSGGYVGQATGQNHTTGPILDRATVSETGGRSNLSGETIADTCDSGNCATRSVMQGEGNALGRSYEFVSGGGTGSSSHVQGGSALDIDVKASIYRTPAYPGTNY